MLRCPLINMDCLTKHCAWWDELLEGCITHTAAMLLAGIMKENRQHIDDQKTGSA